MTDARKFFEGYLAASNNLTDEYRRLSQETFRPFVTEEYRNFLAGAQPTDLVEEVQGADAVYFITRRVSRKKELFYRYTVRMITGNWVITDCGFKCFRCGQKINPDCPFCHGVGWASVLAGQAPE